MYFCLHCFVGKEKESQRLLEKLLNEKGSYNFEVWAPKHVCKIKRNGRFVNVEKSMFDGYLFIWWDGENESEFPFNEAVKIPGVINFLKYDNNQKSLIGKDLSFVSWIHQNSGTIKESKIMLSEGKRVHFIEGPLVGFDGNVVKLDKHHKKVVVRFEIGNQTTDVSFSAEFVEKNITIENLTS